MGQPVHLSHQTPAIQAQEVSVLLDMHVMLHSAGAHEDSFADHLTLLSRTWQPCRSCEDIARLLATEYGRSDSTCCQVLP